MAVSDLGEFPQVICAEKTKSLDNKGVGQQSASAALGGITQSEGNDVTQVHFPTAFGIYPQFQSKDIPKG
jgi:hypothetical protein